MGEYNKFMSKFIVSYTSKISYIFLETEGVLCSCSPYHDLKCYQYCSSSTLFILFPPSLNIRDFGVLLVLFDNSSYLKKFRIIIYFL